MTSFQFEGIPADAAVLGVKVGVEHHQEEQISSGSITWQVDRGSLRVPTTAATGTPALLLGEAREATVEWDVKQAIDTAALVNVLKFRVRNSAAKGQKTKIDRLYVAVRYARTPTAPTITSTPVTSAAVGDAYAYQAEASGTRSITWSHSNSPAGMTVKLGHGARELDAERGRQLPRPLRATNSVRQATESYTVTISPAAPFKKLLAAGDIADCSSPEDEQTAQRYRPLNPAGSADAARGIREFVVGTGGRGPYTLRSDPRREAQDDDTWGVLKLTLRATSHDWKFLPVAGSAYTDSGTGACH